VLNKIPNLAFSVFSRIQRIAEASRTWCWNTLREQNPGTDVMALHSNRRSWGRHFHRSRCRQSADTTWRGRGRWLAETETGNVGHIPLYSRPPKSLEVPGQRRTVGRTTGSAG